MHSYLNFRFFLISACLVFYFQTDTYSNSLFDLSVFATDTLRIKDRAVITNGPIGTNKYFELGNDAIVKGNVTAKSAYLRDRSKINGGITCSGIISRGNQTSISGTVLSNTTIPTFTISQQTVTAGTIDKLYQGGSTYTLVPGAYGKIKLNSNAQLILTSGNYNIKAIYCEPNVKILIDAKNGDVKLNVKDSVKFGNNNEIKILNSEDLFSFQIYSNQNSVFSIGTDVRITGKIVAPFAKLCISSRTIFNGMVYAKNIDIETDVTFNSPIPLVDSNGDRVPDVVAQILGYNPSVPVSTPVVASPNNWKINTKVDNIIKYQTPYGNIVSLAIPANTLASDLVPVMETFTDTENVLPINVTADEKICGIWKMKGSLATGKSIKLPVSIIPEKNNLNFLSTACFNLYFHKDSTSNWEKVMVDSVANGAAWITAASLSGEYVITNNPRHLIFVRDRLGPDGDGTSWDKAFLSLQSALDKARIILSTQDAKYMIEIWVAGGCFDPSTGSSIHASFDIPDRVHLLGGFAGDGTATRDIEKYKSILENRGDYVNRVPVPDSYSNHIITHSRPNLGTFLYIRTIIDGFTIKDGSAGRVGSPPTPNDMCGGGIYIQVGNGGLQMDITNCTFISNNAQFGGAIYVDQNAFTGDLNIENCTFLTNLANRNGGAICVNVNRASTAVYVKNCDFFSNWAYYLGGAIAVDNPSEALDNSEFLITGSCFVGNFAGFRTTPRGGAINPDAKGGAIYIGASMYTDIKTSVFYENICDAKATAVYLGKTLSTSQLSELTNNTFVSNGTSSIGDNITTTSCLLLADNCKVRNSVFWNNGQNEIQLMNTSNSNLTFDHNCNQNFTPIGQYDGGGNINSNPLLTNIDILFNYGNLQDFRAVNIGLRLKGIQSPCFKKGIPIANMPDILNQTRAPTDNLDIGAYYVTSFENSTDFLESVNHDYGFDKIPYISTVANSSDIFISAANSSTAKVCVVINDPSIGYYVKSANESVFTIDGSVGNKYNLLNNVTEITLNVANLSANHSSSILQICKPDNTVVKTLNVEAYAQVVVPDVSFYSVSDASSSSTIPTIKPELSEIKVNANKFLKQAVAAINDVMGNPDLSIPYDLNGNGFLDIYEGINNPEKNIITSFNYTGSNNKIVLVNKIRRCWRLTADVTTGTNIAIPLETTTGLSWNYPGTVTIKKWIIGPESCDGDLSTDDGDEEFSFEFHNVPNARELKKAHRAGDVVFDRDRMIAGISSNPQIIASSPFFYSVFTHEMLHRSSNPNLGGLFDVAEEDNIMSWTTKGNNQNRLRFRNQTVVVSGSGETLQFIENQWDKVHYVGYSLLQIAIPNGAYIEAPVWGSNVYKEGVPIEIIARHTSSATHIFSGWTVISGNCTIADPTNYWTSITLNGGPVIISANWSN